MKKVGIFILILLSLNFVIAIEDSLHINLVTTDSSNNTIKGIYDFNFSISNDSSCSYTIKNYSFENINTNPEGRADFYLDNSSMLYNTQYYLKELRDGVLIGCFKISYSKNHMITNISELTNDLNYLNSSFNQTYQDYITLNKTNYSYFSNYSYFGNWVNDNSTFNQTLTDLLYTNKTYVDSTNNTLSNWVSNLFIKISDVVSYVGNWSLDKVNYYNKSQIDYNDSLNLHLNQDNWFNDSNGWINWDGNSNEFNQSKLSTVYYNVTTNHTVRGTSGSQDISLLQSYNGIPFNVTESSGAVGLDFRVNFTGVDNFNQIIFRYKSISGESHTMNVQLFDFGTSTWENYATLGEVNEYNIKEIGVYDSSNHLSSGRVWMRFYQSSNGNTGHIHYFDWVTIANGYATPSGAEIDPYSWHRNSISESGNFTTSGNVSASYYCNSTNCYTLAQFLIDTTGGVGSNPFDQSLNKSDKVVFSELNLTNIGTDNALLNIINTSGNAVSVLSSDENGATWLINDANFLGLSGSLGIGLLGVSGIQPQSDDLGVDGYLQYDWNVTKSLWVTQNLTIGDRLCLTGFCFNNVNNLTDTHKHSIINITGTDDNSCTGTDKVSNVTFVNGDLKVTCTSDNVNGSLTTTNMTRLFTKLNTDVSTKNSTNFNQTILTLSLSANTNYTIDCGIMLYTSSVAVAPQINMTFPTLTYGVINTIQMTASDTFDGSNCAGAISSCAYQPAVGIVTPGTMTNIKGRLETSSAGNFVISLKSETGTTTTVSAGRESYCGFWIEP